MINNPYYWRRRIAFFVVIFAFLAVLSTCIAPARALDDSENETVTVRWRVLLLLK